MMAKQIFDIRLPSLYPKQYRVWYDAARMVFCEGTTKSGKSMGGLHWIMNAAFSWAAGMSLLWCSPVYQQAEVMFTRLCRFMLEIDPVRLAWQEHKQKLMVSLGNTSVWFKGSDNPDSIYGSDHAGAVVDEASRCKEEAWHAVLSTLSATNGPVRCIGNVKGRRNWFYQLCRKAESGAAGMSYHKLTWKDAVEATDDNGNPIMLRETVEDARRVLPPDQFAQLFEADASDDGGNPFGIAAIASRVAPLSNGTPAVFGVDLARAQDWTVAIGLDASGATCRFERWQHVPWNQTIDRLATIIGKTPTLADATGVGDPIVEELQRRCPNKVERYVFSSTSKQVIMQALASSIHQGLVSYPDGPIRSELETFEYEYTQHSVRYSAPDGFNDDCVYGLGLASYHLGIRSRKPPVYVNVIGGGRAF